MLKPKEQLFVDGVVAGKDQKQAWIEAGFAPKAAAAAASRALTRVNIREAVQRGLALRQQEPEQQRDRILQELSRIAFADIRNLTRVNPETGLPEIDFRNATDAEWAALNSIATKRRKIYNGKGEHVATEDTAKFTKLDKLRGLELLGRHHGMFKEQHEVEVVDVAARILKARAAKARALSGPEEGSE